MKLCKDCKHYRRAFAGSEFSKCAKRVNPVNGKADRYCSTMRSGYSNCGASANDFEPKPRFNIIRLVLGVA